MRIEGGLVSPAQKSTSNRVKGFVTIHIVLQCALGCTVAWSATDAVEEGGVQGFVTAQNDDAVEDEGKASGTPNHGKVSFEERQILKITFL